MFDDGRGPTMDESRSERAQALRRFREAMRRVDVDSSDEAVMALRAAAVPLMAALRSELEAETMSGDNAAVLRWARRLLKQPAGALLPAIPAPIGETGTDVLDPIDRVGRRVVVRLLWDRACEDLPYEPDEESSVGTIVYCEGNADGVAHP
jgi:hypothetical protein